MPKITEDTPQRDMIISGMPFKVPAPYSEGHVLTATEASALNGLLGENLRNNFAAQIKKLNDAAEAEKTEKPGLEMLQGLFSDYAAEYEFGVRRTASGSVGTSADPVERELQSMARAIVKTRIKERGHKLKSFPEDTIQELVDSLIAARPAMREEAERRVAAAIELSKGGDDIGELPTPLPEPAPAEAAAEAEAVPTEAAA